MVGALICKVRLREQGLFHLQNSFGDVLLLPISTLWKSKDEMDPDSFGHAK